MAGRLSAVMACLTAAAIGVAGCDRPSRTTEIEAVDASARDYEPDFTLIDQYGKPRHLSEFRGKVVALFFGFTHCPEVCPTTLADFAQVDRMLGAQAQRVQVVFVTVDPERDTQQVLSQYVPAFDSRFLGLSGSSEQIHHAADAFEVTYRKIPAGTGGDYTMDHTSYVFLLDPSGHLRLKVPYGQGAEALVKLIRELMA